MSRRDGLSEWTGTAIALTVDATALGERFVVLTVSVVYRGTGIPVAWTVLAGQKKEAWRGHWLRGGIEDSQVGSRPGPRTLCSPQTPPQKSRSQETRRSLSWRHRTPKTDAVAGRQGDGVAVRDAGVVPVAGPTAPAQHLILPARRPLRVLVGRTAVVVAPEPVVHPLPHVAAHIQSTVGAGAGGIVPHPAGVAHAVVPIEEVGQPAVRRLVPPRVHAGVGAAARGLLPLRLRRQPLAGPGAIVGRVVPRDVE